MYISKLWPVAFSITNPRISELQPYAPTKDSHGSSFRESCGGRQKEDNLQLVPGSNVSGTPGRPFYKGMG